MDIALDRCIWCGRNCYVAGGCAKNDVEKSYTMASDVTEFMGQFFILTIT